MNNTTENTQSETKTKHQPLGTRVPSQENAIIAWLELKRDKGKFNSMDVHLARFIHESLTPFNHVDVASRNLIVYLAALVSRNSLRQHTCLSLDSIPHIAESVSAASLKSESSDAPDVIYTFELPAKQHWQEVLKELEQATQLVECISTNETVRADKTALEQQGLQDVKASSNPSELIHSDSGTSPFVLVGDLFYMRRYFQYEKLLSNFVLDKVASTLAENLPNALGQNRQWFNGLTTKQIEDVVDPLFGSSSNGSDTKDSDTNSSSNSSLNTDWQKAAVLNSVNCGFSIISGGPGTGKTTTVIKLLLALLRLKQVTQEEDPFLDNSSSLSRPRTIQAITIQLVAPTGKAAQRLSESMVSSAAKLDVSDTEKQLLPSEALTIHRLLKPKGMNAFFHDQQNPLALDVLIVDEASMVDISLMNRLIAAMPSHAQLVLLGDQQQLTSVEAGNVLGDLCNASQTIESKGLGGSGFQVELQKSYRFDDASAIGKLAKAVKTGIVRTALNAMEQGQIDSEYLVENIGMNQELLWYKPELNQMPILIENAVSHYIKLFEHARATSGANSPDALDQMFSVLSEFQLLACVKQSEWGVDHLNQQIQLRLARRLKVAMGSVHYVGRPIMITENAYHMGLYNGDIGIEVFDPSTNQLVAVFQDTTVSQNSNASLNSSAGSNQNQTKGYKQVACQRLPAHQTCYAMTVHKSQGSEFDHAVLIVPEQKSLVHNISRELVYTGLTRAKKRFSLFSSEHAFASAIQKRTVRYSGLAQMITQAV